jgi:hypothetical protein
MATANSGLKNQAGDIEAKKMVLEVVEILKD